jgi:hypothetical protein
LIAHVSEDFLDFKLVARTIVRISQLHPKSAKLHGNGVGVLQNICNGALWSLAVLPANQSRIAQANGINMALSGLFATATQANADFRRAQQQGCGCLSTLAIDPSNRISIREAGGVDALVLSARAHFDNMQVHTVAKLLETFCRLAMLPLSFQSIKIQCCKQWRKHLFYFTITVIRL